MVQKQLGGSKFESLKGVMGNCDIFFVPNS